MTDIDDFVNAPGRDEAVKQVREKINKLGVTYIYYQFVSVTGRIVGKGAPADHWERISKNGFQLVYGSTANLFIDRFDNYIGYGPEAWELVGMPEPETFVQLPWEPRVARVFCTCFRGREHEEDPGAFLTSDCRGNLRRLHQKFQGDHGLHLRAGTEPEMMWLKKDADGNPAGGVSQPYCYHIEQFEQLRPIQMRVTEYARAMGLDMIQGDHEDAPGQLEQNFQFDEVLRNADRLTTYRQICAQVGREFNVIPCFMSKPFMSVSASACHTNISLWKGGEESVKTFGQEPLPGMEQPFTYVEGGDNAFMPEGDNPRKPGKVGLQALGGIIEHLPGITVLGASTVNSYKRFLEPGFWAPMFCNWGFQNRTTSVRNSAPGRFEYKAVDSMHNPYLMGAGLLMSMDDGLKRDLDPGPPEQRNIYDYMDEIAENFTKLPMSLGKGIEALEADPVAQSALPGEMHGVFMHYKKDEWEKFLSTVTEWDLRTYIDCLP